MGLKRLGNLAATGASEEEYEQMCDPQIMSELAGHFCDFLALDKLRLWAEQNLRESSLK